MLSAAIQDLDLPRLGTRLAGILVLTYGALKYFEAKRSPIGAIPTIGHSGVLTSYITALKWMKYGEKLVEEGYDRYPSGVFKVASLSKWLVFVTGKQFLDELRKAPDEVLSLQEGINEVKYTMGTAISDDPYQIVTVRSPITRNLVVRFGDIADEIAHSFKMFIPPSEEWTAVPAYDTIMHIICRTTNRYFTGLPLCRDPGYISLQEKFTIEAIVSARIINCFPDFLKPLVGRCLTTAPGSVKKAVQYLGPMIEERLKKEEEYGPDWPDKPNDLISWLLETAQGYQRTAQDIALRILAINLASIHTSTTAFTHALYDLAVHPEYIKEMREEAETVIEEQGWTKAAMREMRKIDSFLKESQRLNNGGAQIFRKTLKDWTLSNGTVIPAGQYIGVAGSPMNKEEAWFTDGRTFNGFRFSDMRNGGGELDSIKYQMVALTLDMTTFGHGRHACPGRFFAVNQLKTAFAYVILNYDVQLEGGSLERPQNFEFEAITAPNRKAKMMFRKRAPA